MKESDYYKKIYDETDSDIKAFGAYRNIWRAEKQEKFEEKHLPIFKEKFKDDIFFNEKTGAYIIKQFDPTLDKILHFDFYPKANKVLVRHLNTWHKAGLQWLLNNVLNKDSV